VVRTKFHSEDRQRGVTCKPHCLLLDACGLMHIFVCNKKTAILVLKILVTLRYLVDRATRRPVFVYPLPLSEYHYGPGVDRVSDRNEYQEYFLGRKGGRCLGLTNPTTFMKSGSLNFLEPSGPIPACNRIALPFLHWTLQQFSTYTIHAHLTLVIIPFSHVRVFLVSVQLLLLVLCTRCSTLCATHTAAQPSDVSSNELLHPREIFRRQKRNSVSYCIVRIELSWTFPLSLEKKVKQYSVDNSYVWWASSYTRVCSFRCTVWPAKFSSGGQELVIWHIDSDSRLADQTEQMACSCHLTSRVGPSTSSAGFFFGQNLTNDL
jgi:hypothetical protein